MRIRTALKSIGISAVLLAGMADAHGGFENETEVRVDPDRMRVVVRTSLPFAWTILGKQAPPTADEAGQAVAKPLLAAAAPGLFEITAGGTRMTPVKSDCLFEVHDHVHVAFIVEFERPPKWPVTLRAAFFPLFGELDTGAISVFDHSASRFSRDIEPVVRKVIDARDPVVSFDLRTPEPASLPRVLPPTPDSKAESPAHDSNSWLVPLLFLAAGIAGWLVRAGWRRSRAAS